MWKYLIRFGIFSSLVALVVLGIIFYQEHRPYDWTPAHPDEAKETLRVAADMGFSPISFLDENGNPAGHDVELIYKIGEKLGVNIEVELVQWSEAIRMFQQGEYDLLLGVSNLPGREGWLTLSKPYLNAPCVLFGSRDQGFHMTDFAGKRLAYLASDSAVMELIESYDLVPATYSSYRQCFEAMTSGECDYAISPAPVGKRILKEMGSHEFEVKDIYIHNNIFSVGVHSENTELLEAVNAALDDLTESGELSAIHKHWLVDYVGANNLASLMAAEPVVFILLAVAVSFAFFIACLYLEYRRKLNMIRREQEHNQLLMLKNDIAAKNIRNIQHSVTTLAEFRHDWQKHLSILVQYYREDPERAAAYAEELLGASQSISVISYTKNPLVNTILNVQAGNAQEKAVLLCPEILLPETLPVPEQDLCAILMNLLDNAIEAAGRAEGKRSVALQIRIAENDLLICVKNSLPRDFDPVVFAKILLRRPNPGKDEHGFGIPSTNAILKNYGGQLRYTIEDGNMAVRTAMRLAGRAVE